MSNTEGYEVIIPVDTSLLRYIEWFHMHPHGGGNGEMLMSYVPGPDMGLALRLLFTNLEDYVAFQMTFGNEIAPV
jgi:hypothetical protein